ncbi:MAG: serine/threonine protein kinase, partial [Proteobacteria bacterium]|nr:serine/threonine protein kinase [Pseudomonadota bacterium]
MDPSEASSGLLQKREFSFQRCLGSGGFGEVYLATMTSSGGVETDVAVKVLHGGLDPRSQAVQRLRDEGRLLGVLNHPAILRVTDLVLLEGRIALVTEYVEGADLDECFGAHPPLPPRALLEVIGRVADALHSAFNTTSANGTPLELIHRDIKPANIRLGRHGDVKLLDFGIARAT